MVRPWHGCRAKSKALPGRLKERVYGNRYKYICTNNRWVVIAVPTTVRLTAQAAVRSFNESFPYVHCFPSVEGWGIHLLGSMDPIDHLNAAQLAARMPDNAKKDLLEWYPANDATFYLAKVITHEYSVPAILNPDLDVQITDDNPFNEYFLLRSYTVK
jgi:hypothetical protein